MVNYTNDEDVALCTAYVKVSIDGKKGDRQKHGKFWDKVTTKFDEIFNNSYNRDRGSLNNRFNAIAKEVNLWVGVVKHQKRLVGSGEHYGDVLKHAEKEFVGTYGHKFALGEV